MKFYLVMVLNLFMGHKYMLQRLRKDLFTSRENVAFISSVASIVLLSSSGRYCIGIKINFFFKLRVHPVKETMALVHDKYTKATDLPFGILSVQIIPFSNINYISLDIEWYLTFTRFILP